MDEIKACACGHIPEKLIISEGSTFSWRYIEADCGCGWMIEARVTTPYPIPDEYEECVQSWNDMPRSDLESQLSKVTADNEDNKRRIEQLTHSNFSQESFIKEWQQKYANTRAMLRELVDAVEKDQKAEHSTFPDVSGRKAQRLASQERLDRAIAAAKEGL